MADTEPTPPSQSCAKCKKTANADVTLSRCSRCRTSYYCSKDCQREDWKEHKKNCGSQSGSDSTGGATRGTSSFNILKDQLWGGSNRWLHNRPEDEAYGLIIDSYRMRIEDEYMYRGDAGGLYADEDPVEDFREFLGKAEQRQGVLPSWWSAEKREACVRKGDSPGGWGSLHGAVEKSDIIEHYNDPMMPMQLRMLAEEVLGSNVMNPA